MPRVQDWRAGLHRQPAARVALLLAADDSRGATGQNLIVDALSSLN